MSYTLHRAAEQDLLEAATFYRLEGGARLANRFLDEFERVAQLLVAFPGIGSPIDALRRAHPLRDFPYSVIYRHVNQQIRVLVVRSHWRDPAHGALRR